MAAPVQTLRGFRDYLPAEMMAKERMLHRVRHVFESFGYPPLQTPALEYGELLAGKYGEEGEMLMYRFRDNGDRDVCMRYDLTVPLARVVGQYGQLPMPFRRYQIAPVWRAEKPAKGRYREFMQCDVDLIGIDDVSADAEMVLIDMAVVAAQGIDAFKVRLNHRGVLRGITRSLGLEDGEPEAAFLRWLDKLDKIGADKFQSGVAQEFSFTDAQLQRLMEAVTPSGNPRETLATLQSQLSDDPDARAGLDRLSGIMDIVDACEEGDRLVLDPSIARGLSYYDGVIYETFLDELPQFGSVMSGGRYNGLVGALCGRDLPAVGNSLGVDRLFAALQELGLETSRTTPSDVLVVRFDAESAAQSTALAQRFRKGGINTEVYPTAAKLKKQFQFANNAAIPFVVIQGSDERERGTVTLKDMAAGDQQELEVDRAVEWVRERGRQKGLEE